MRKRILYIIVTILSFFSFFNIVNAEDYVSEMTPRDKKIENVQIGKINLEYFYTIKYYNFKAQTGVKIEYDGKFSSEFSDVVTVIFTVDLYDKNQNFIYELKKEVESKEFNQGLYFDVMYAGENEFSLDDVVYYVLKIDIPTKSEIFDGADRGSYFYQDFKTEINILENNVYEFNQSFKGIFKGASRALNYYIPCRHIYTSSDGKNINKRAVISDVKVSDEYTASIETGNYTLTIGKSEADILEKEYAISYTYNVGKDKLKGNDELILYLVKDLEVSIDGYSFIINLPKEFDEEKLTFIDEFGNKLENVNYEIEGNTIKGSIDDIISEDSVYLLKLILPDNYFVNTSRNISTVTWISFIVPMVLMIVTIVLCFISKRTKNNKNEHASLYIDEDLDSLELGYILKGSVKETDISSLIFGLANKKYVEIEMEKGNYTITKLTEYTGTKKAEEILMKRLFQKSDVVTRKDLKENLKNVKEEIEKALKYKKGKRFYIKPVLNYKLLFWVMIFFIYYINMKNLLIEYQPSDIFITVSVGFIGLIAIFGSILSNKYQVIEKILCVLVGIVLIVSPIILTSYLAFTQDILYVASYILGIICIVSIAITSSLMNDRTSYGNFLYRKIVAYKDYLTKVSEIEIKEGLESNSNYFYDVLPYVLVMGMSDKFYSKFENINLNGPSWYETSKFNLEDFYNEVKNIYSDFFIAMKNK